MRRPEACGDGDVDLAMEKIHEHVQKMRSDEREQERGKRGTKGRRSGPALRFTGDGRRQNELAHGQPGGDFFRVLA